MLELLKAFILGIIEGITEWLPISSTGHMILVDEFLKLNASNAFKEMFFVVIQLGAILAVVVLYWNRLFPFSFKGGLKAKPDTFVMWLKVVVSCIPTAIVGVLWDDELHALFYNYQTVAVMLILFGVLFIVVENLNKNKTPKVTTIAGIGYGAAFVIGLFQLVAAVFPGTSRSGATIVGALLLGISRTAAAEYTFFLSVPVMFGASLLKLVKFGFHFTTAEAAILAVGCLTAFVVSVFAIKFLMNYIKKNSFKPFGWYRIALGALVLAYFLLQ
ncbi:MAG: undecaprenyl-diphosphate phosphatase [Oscillospiraceae bacterium]